MRFAQKQIIFHPGNPTSIKEENLNATLDLNKAVVAIATDKQIETLSWSEREKEIKDKIGCHLVSGAQHALAEIFGETKTKGNDIVHYVDVLIITS